MGELCWASFATLQAAASCGVWGGEETAIFNISFWWLVLLHRRIENSAKIFAFSRVGPTTDYGTNASMQYDGVDTKLSLSLLACFMEFCWCVVLLDTGQRLTSLYRSTLWANTCDRSDNKAEGGGGTGRVSPQHHAKNDSKQTPLFGPGTFNITAVFQVYNVRPM